MFSYQPPFNLLALIILKPASWIISPRALHSLNVLLIKLTSFPILIIIGLYERYFSAGQRLRESSKGAAHSLFNSLPRRIKNMPILEALVGSNSSDLYEAIFDVELTHEFDLFNEESEDEFLALRSVPSHESLSTSPRKLRPPSLTRSLHGGDPPSPQRSQGRNVGLQPTHFARPPSPTDQQGGRSPLARLFAPRLQASRSEQTAAVEHAEASVRRVEAVLNDIRDLPVRKLKDEMKELQVG